MTPAQEAKEFAAAHGFLITQVGRRYVISDEMKLAGEEFANVGGYPAALNAMKRYVEELKDIPVFPLGWKAVDTSVEEGETRVPDAGAPTLVLAADALLNMPHVAIPTKTRAEIIEDMRIGLGLSPGVLEHVATQEAARQPRRYGTVTGMPGTRWDVAASIYEAVRRIPFKQRHAWCIVSTSESGNIWVEETTYNGYNAALKRCRQLRNDPRRANDKRVIYRMPYIIGSAQCN